MKKKKTLEDQINEFLEVWNFEEMATFLRNVIPLIELYDVDENDDWVKKTVKGNEEEIETVRLIRTVYLLSKISKDHAAKFAYVNVHFKDLWKKMQDENK